MKKVAVLITVFNRSVKTHACLSSLFLAWDNCKNPTKPQIDVYVTNDGSTDNTEEVLAQLSQGHSIKVIQGTGSLFWNHGMISSWEASIDSGIDYDGYLWLNNDVEALPCFWDELIAADEYSTQVLGIRGIYVGSVKNKETGEYTYGGFNYTSKVTLKDEFVVPDGNWHTCQCAHGNITYVSSNVVKRQGIFCENYIHGGTDHDYTYLAYKAGFPIVVMREYVGFCKNDHGLEKSMSQMTFKERIIYVRSPLGFNLHNTLLFNKRCFPYRYPFVLFSSIVKICFPNLGSKLYMLFR